MMTQQQLAELMFPTITATPADIEAQFPARQLPEGARVTRVAPSPTGYLHLGVFYTAMVNRLTADATKGIFYFRLEDTDKKREVEGGADDILTGMGRFGLAIDEGFVAPGKVVAYSRNYVTNRVMEDAGIEVLTIPSSELSRGRGGPRCMTMPLIRASI